MAAQRAALDAESAIRAAAGAELARGLMIAAAVVCLVAAAAIVAEALRRRRRRDGRDPSGRETPHLPWGALLAGAAVVALVAGLIGLWSTQVNGSIVLEGATAGALGSALGWWSIGALTLGALGLLAGIVPIRGGSAPSAGGATAVLALGLVVLVGAATATELPRPERQVSATAAVDGDVQATITLTPGAEGPNAARVILSGPSGDLRRIRTAVEADGATISLRPLAAPAPGPPIPLRLDGQGALVGDDLEADAAGRARVTVQLPRPIDPVVVDVTLQPNPGRN